MPFGGVAAGLPEATIGGAVTLAIGIGIQNFPEGIAVSFPFASRWCKSVEEFTISVKCRSRTCGRCYWRLSRYLFLLQYYPLP